MTEVPPASSVGEQRSPRRESTFSISPPSPTHCRKCHDWRLFRVDQPRPATLLSPQPAPTSTDAPKSPLRGCRLMPYHPRIVANRDTSQQKRQACADVAAFTSPVAWHARAPRSTPMSANTSAASARSQGSPTCDNHQRHPGSTTLDHTAHHKLPWICGRSDHCQIGAEARPERG